MQPSMVSLADEEVQRQMHALHEFEDDPLPVPPPPEGFEDDKKFDFELGNITVSARD